MPKTSSQPKTVLVVEDDDALRQVLVDELAAAGFAAAGVSDGEQAIDHVLRQEPDLLLVDVILPKIDGITLLHYLRAGSHNTPAIVLSNLEVVGPDVQKLAVEDYLVKSEWKLKDVIGRVKLFFSDKKSKRRRKKSPR